MQLLCVLAAGFLLYVVAAIAVTLVFMIHVAPAHGTTSIYVYITICSLVGSLSVMSCKVWAPGDNTVLVCILAKLMNKTEFCASNIQVTHLYYHADVQLCVWICRP